MIDFFDFFQFLRIDFLAKINININRLILINLRCSGNLGPSVGLERSLNQS